MPNLFPPTRSAPAARRAFTVIEVLIVIGVVILLLSILIVATNKAVQAAQTANTRTLMTSMTQAMERFREDVGYYPPVLTADRNLDWLDVNDGSFQTIVQDFHSITTPAEYFYGYGDEAADGYGRGTNGALLNQPGIRNPGRDGVWGATRGQTPGASYGLFSNRNVELSTSGVSIEGTVLGPYLDLSDDRVLGSINGDTDPAGNPIVYFPGEANYDDDDPKVIADYWGSPIRYYRRPYPEGAITQPFRVRDRDGDGIIDPVPTLSDVFVLRPWDIPPGAAVDNRYADASSLGVGGGGDTSTTVRLNGAEYAFFSPGPDKAFDPTVRYDNQDYNSDGFDYSNEDNIVEVGP